MGYPCSGFWWKAVTLLSCPGKLCLGGLDLGEEFDVVADASLYRNQVYSFQTLSCLCPLPSPLPSAVFVSLVLPDTSLCVGTAVDFSVLQNVI